jgi:hypothetical protein
LPTSPPLTASTRKTHAQLAYLNKTGSAHVIHMQCVRCGRMQRHCKGGDMKPLAMLLLAEALIGGLACDGEHDGASAARKDADDTEDAGDRDATTAAANGGAPAYTKDSLTHLMPGDLTGWYNLHVDVVSDTCSPQRTIAADTEVLVWGDHGRDLFRVPLPDTDVAAPDEPVILAQLQVPLEQHVSPDLLVASCPDARLDVETGPFEFSGQRIVVPMTESWRHSDDCSNGRVGKLGFPPPAEDCALQVVLTLDWSRPCPPPPDRFLVDGGAVAYCD